MSLKSLDIPIIGDSNAVPQDDPEYTLNFYAEKVSDEVYTLKPTPGTTLQYQMDFNGGSRGLISVSGRLFGVRGAFFQEIVAGANILLGTLGSGAGKVAMIANSPPNGAAQILIVDDGAGYVFDLGDSSFVTLTGAGGDNFLGGGSQAAYCAGRALVFKPSTQSFQMSNLYDFKTWTTTTAGSAFTLTTPILSVVSNGDLAYFFSSGGFEIWSDQGLPTLPIGRILAGDKIGILAPNSALFCERHVYWLGKSSTGQGIVYRHSGGGEPERISNHSTERNIAALADPSDGNAFTYTSFGHVFYIVSFTAGNRTFAWDKATSLWHDRAQREPLSNAQNALPFIAVVIHNGMVLEADYRNGDIMEIDETAYTDNGNPIARERILPVTPKEGDFFTFYQSAELFGEIGPPPASIIKIDHVLYDIIYDPPTIFNTTLWSLDNENIGSGDHQGFDMIVASRNGPPVYTTAVNGYGGNGDWYTTTGMISNASYNLAYMTAQLDINFRRNGVLQGSYVFSVLKINNGPIITLAILPADHSDATINALYIEIRAKDNSTILYTATEHDIASGIQTYSSSRVFKVVQTSPGVFDVYMDNAILISGYDSEVTGDRTIYMEACYYAAGNFPSGLTNTWEGHNDWRNIYIAAPHTPTPPVIFIPPPTNIMMRISRDRGMTWEPEQWQQVGGNATYMGRTRWVGLGASYGLSLMFKIIAAQYISWRGVRLRLQ